MKIVIDANLIVSAFGWGGKPAILIDRIVDKLDTLFITNDITNEIRRTFHKPKFKKKNFTEDWINSVVNNIDELSYNVTVLPQHKATGASRDPKDDMYIECALAAGADYIISGDIHLRELIEYKGIKIVLVAQYLEIVNGA